MFKQKKKAVLLFLMFAVYFLIGCHITEDREETMTENSLENRNKNISSELFYENSINLQYAKQFTVDYYQDGYCLISTVNGRSYLIVPENKKEPQDLDKDIVILKQPMEHIYLVATAVMDMFCELDALGLIRFSGQRKDGWCRQEVQREMEQENILYAGKYNAPDYERILSEGCSLAIENTMISHSPEVMEKLESFEIPVFIDLSSYESHPLGRVEWIKLYGVLLGKENEAKTVFEKQRKLLEQVEKEKASGKTVAFFFLTANGMVNVRASSDYVPKMIELAGGTYIFDDLGEEDSHRSSITMQMEEFYLKAGDADYLLYNSTIDGEITSVEELLQKEALLKDFKAVQENRVYCTTKDLYQQSMSIGQMIDDIYNMMLEETDKQKKMKYIYHL